MPLTDSYAAFLAGRELIILPQIGNGWAKLPAEGGRVDMAPPRALFFVQEVELVRPADAVIGFTGIIKCEVEPFDNLRVLAVTHTTELLAEAAVVPLLMVLSPGTPRLVPHDTALIGYHALPVGHPAYAGFGLLSPPAVD